MKRSQFSKSEHRLLILCGALILFLVGSGSWWTWSNTTPQIVIPAPPPAPNPNAFDFFVRASNSAIAAPPSFSDEERTLDLAQFADFKKRYPLSAREKWLNQNSAVLTLIRQGFAYRSQYPPRTGWQRSFSKMRELSRLLTTESKVRAVRGNWKGAAQSTLDEIRLGNGVVNGGTIIPYLHGYSMNTGGIDNLQALSGSLNAATARGAALQLHELIRNVPTAADAIFEEKWMNQKWLKDLFSHSDWRKQFAAEDAQGQASALFIANLFAGRQPTRWDTAKIWATYYKDRVKTLSFSKRRIFMNFNTVMDAAIAAAKQPYDQVKPKRGKDFFSDLLVDVYVTPRWNEARLRAKASLLEAALALRAYRLEHGIYPASLDALVPNYLPSVPGDAFNANKPLRYKRDRATYTLWSVGPDGQDNGGQTTRDSSRVKQGQTLVQPDSKGDFVYGVNH